MKVLSLFDGMACGMIAMLNAGVQVDEYHAYEIDKYAIKVATHNFPKIQEHGDVFAADFTQYEGFDFVIGGSPCTHWSIAQTKNRETEASGIGWDLFSQYVRAIKEAKPRYFVYENNYSMSKNIRKAIDEAFGFEAVMINSALLSAQSRKRLYWVGIRNEDGTYSRADVKQPEDKGILLRDILENSIALNDKGHAVLSSSDRTTEREYFRKNQGTMCAERIPDYGADKARPVNALYPNNCGGFEHRLFNPNPAKQQVDLIAEPVQPLSEAEMDYMMRDHQDQRWSFCNKPSEDDKSKCIVANVHKGVPYNVCAEPININEDGKSQTLKAQYAKNSVANFCCYSSTYGASAAAEPLQVGKMPREDGVVTDSKPYGIYSADEKAVTQCGQGGGMGAKTGLYAVPADAQAKKTPVYEVKDGQITVKGKQYPIKLKDGLYIIRKLTVAECARLQTVPHRMGSR